MAGRRLRIGNLIGSGVLLALTLGTFALAWSMVEEELRFLAGSRIVSGEVIDHVYVRRESRGPRRGVEDGAYYELASFSDGAGRLHQVQARSGSTWGPGDARSQSALQQRTGLRPLGATVRVAYPPGQPEQARMLGFAGQYLLPSITAGIGLMLGLFTVLVWRDRYQPSAGPDASAAVG